MNRLSKITALLGVLFSFVLFISCGSKEKIEYRVIDEERVEALNARIEENILASVEDIAAAYRPKDEYAEGDYSYTVNSAITNEEVLEITIREEGAMDDSIYGVIAILTIDVSEDNWKVTSIKEAYKCWPNRGHQEWGPEFCN